MRRLLATVVVLVVCLPLTGLASGSEKTVRDDFKEVSYSGSDGNHPWAGPWQEVGESDGAGSGQIQVQGSNCSNNQCLHMKGGALSQVEITRAADLSGLTSATLSFDLARSHAGLASTGVFTVQARGNGRNWETLQTYLLLTTPASSSPSFDVGHLAGTDFHIRFRLTGLLSGDMVYIDRVEVAGQVPEPITTTSSSTSTTSTTTSSTPSTSVPKPTTTSSTSTSTTSTTTTSIPGVETTTTVVAGPDRGSDGPERTDDAGATTSTFPGTSDDAEGAIVAGVEDGPPSGGLRAPAIGLIADYRPGSMGQLEAERVEVLGAELAADFELAVETFETARIGLAVLSLLIAASVVSGMDRKRSRTLQT